LIPMFMLIESSTPFEWRGALCRLAAET
jgi:hypothetical protein